ncbi:hypothetical protein H5410_019755 [Solanum commersonii]|uniref:NB-ARC domain-containing protein n=1 Tax=Solanum commersonii TaxID=4109 RepID=A0A9J5Z775_SOLCO|nr:hypothetical protein H5410_019755 [Solanum commersonii]
MIEYLYTHLHDYKILRQVFRHLRDFYGLECIAPNKTTTEYLYPRYLMIVDRVTQLCFDLWTGKYNYEIDYLYSKIASLLINIIPLVQDVLYIFPIDFLTDIPKRFIHRDKLNDMLAHVGVLTRKMSILVSKLLEESSESNINEADFSAPELLQEIEQIKGDIRLFFMKAPESSQLAFLWMMKEIGMVKQSLEFVRSSFRKVRQTLDDTSGVAKDCWVRALDVAYEAEHVINSILVRDKALSLLIFSLPNAIDKINLIVAEVTSLRLEDKNGDHLLDAKSSDEPIESTSSSLVEVTVGHEEDEAKMIDQLLDKHESKLDIISIVGMPGVGKTTLANKVYNNSLVASHFNVRAWCTVSQKYNKSKVLQEILQQVPHVSGGSEYLILLDDVWDIATGEMLIACFPQVERGNRVILTSRSSEVGLKVKCRTDPLDLQVLTPEKSWELFEKRVFGEGSCPAELSDVGHQIVEKCQGLPLAIVLIAGVIVRLRKGKEKKKDLWLKIQDNLDSFISANINSQMMKVMQLSYDHLPYHLKPLLLYFSRSQKSKRTPVSTLMQLWMAKGLVDHDSLEEATQSYLDALISSSLIMVEHRQAKSLKELRLCNFSLRPDLLSAIAALPQLKILELMGTKFMEDKWDAMLKLSEWKVDRETFPKLEELILEDCYKLMEIPCAFIDIHTLKSIHLTEIRRELGDSAIEIKKAIETFTEEERLHVHVSDVYDNSSEEDDED